MTHVPQPSLISQLPDPLVERLKSGGEWITFMEGDSLSESGRIRMVFFIEEGQVSLIDPETNLELAVVGRESLVGHPALLDCAHSTYRAEASSPVRALAVPLGAVRDAMTDPAVRTTLMCAVDGLFRQIAENLVACTSSVKTRLARRLLLAAERDGDVLRMTHDQLARKLLVRRPGVTVALHELEGDQLLRNTRGAIAILDKEGLRSMASHRRAPLGTTGTMSSQATPALAN